MRVVRMPGIHHDANATLVIGSRGSVLIDVGTSWYQLLIQERILGQLKGVEELEAILLTCRRFNHCGGAGFIASQFGDPDIFIEAGAASALAMGDFSSTGAGRFDSDMPPTITESVVDGQRWDLGDCIVEAIALPGHTGDGMGYWMPKQKIAAVGPVIPRMENPSRWDMMGGNLPDLADSVETLLELDLEMLIPGYGDAIVGPLNVKSVLKRHLAFFEECISNDGSPPEHWARASQMSTYLTPRTAWPSIGAEEE